MYLWKKAPPHPQVLPEAADAGAGSEAGGDVRPRYLVNHAKDLSEPQIRDGLEKAGFTVWDALPCDLLTWRPDKGFQLLECKTPTKTGKRRKRLDQEGQAEFLKLTGTPVALTPEMALQLLGAVT